MYSDIDEWASNTSLCDQISTKRDGSYTCSCNTGYTATLLMVMAVLVYLCVHMNAHSAFLNSITHTVKGSVEDNVKGNDRLRVLAQEKI